MYTYITNLSVGTPPQSLRAVVDLDWADLILPSSTCISAIPRFCNPFNASYDANASSTYHENGTITNIRYGPLVAKARLSEDVLTFTDEVRVPAQIFHEITHYTDWWDFENLGFPFPDGVLGLAIDKERIPGQFGTPGILPSPFKNMVDQKILEKNMFSIVFPSEEREQGSLTFGGYDEDLLDGELISHPIYPENTTQWQFEIQSVSLKGSYNGSPERLLMHKKIPHTKAWLLSTQPLIGFGGSIPQELHHYISGVYDGCVIYPSVSCDDLSSLPDIIIGLKGQNITVRGQDYVSKVTLTENLPCPGFEEGRERCYVMIPQLAEEDVVILGTPFLKRVMGVWNWDTQTVSCEFSNFYYTSVLG